jgi:hypothetical protein
MLQGINNQLAVLLILLSQVMQCNIERWGGEGRFTVFLSWERMLSTFVRALSSMIAVLQPQQYQPGYRHLLSLLVLLLEYGR